MVRARQHLIDREIVSVPDDERISVIATPEYLRNVIPFAAYFEPPKFDPNPAGIYVVTPSVGGDPNAMREHNRSAISNTSIHEAYPGHHLQLSVATRHPSLTRLITDAPEFVEGWGMYSEQMMREQGFDDAPNFRLNMYTDAIWRAVRIILDVRMHCGEISVPDAIRFMVDETSFEEANARAEVHRYTYTPSYQLSYLLGKVLLKLRADEQRRLGTAFDLRRFHDTLLENGGLPISFHRRLLERDIVAKGGRPWAARARAPRRLADRRSQSTAPESGPGAGHPLDRPRARSFTDRLLAGGVGRCRRAHRPARGDRGALRRARRARRAPGGLRRRPHRRSRQHRHARSRRGSGRDRSGCRRHGGRGPDPDRVRRRRDARGARDERGGGPVADPCLPRGRRRLAR